MIRSENLAILGSTGSIGRNALLVAESIPDLNVWGITGCRNLELLCAQCLKLPNAFVVAANSDEAEQFTFPESLRSRLRIGMEHLNWMASHPDVTIVLAAIVGSAGVISTHAAVEAGKRVALANKESLVAAGQILIPLAKLTGAQIIPVDSEHSAIWQASLAGRKSEIERVILTASGGPFRGWSNEELTGVTPESALEHPTWNMGPKITIDSATLMNKALEIIEARWLFDLEPEQISVMIHPQSIVHSLVEFRDGSVIAQLSPPDMKLPIQYALSYPERVSGGAERVNWSQRMNLELIPPNEVQSEALSLGFEVARRGGTSGAVLNAANESAISAFLAGEIKFTEIVAACREVLQQHEFRPATTLDEVMLADSWAREEIAKWIGV
jgi:1-deoxy-D-xylulose-5-phosphate reductoisomerase